MWEPGLPAKSALTVTATPSSLQQTAHRLNLRHFPLAHVNPQRLADVDPLIDVLIEQQLNPLAAQGHGLLGNRRPDEFTGGNDAVIGHVHAERVFAEAHDVLAGLAVEADKTLEVVGSLADELGSDAHGKPHEKDRWSTRRAVRHTLCRGDCRGQAYCKQTHKSAEIFAFGTFMSVSR